METIECPRCHKPRKCHCKKPAGPTGPTGPAGPVGLTGATGPTGPVGPGISEEIFCFGLDEDNVTQAAIFRLGFNTNRLSKPSPNFDTDTFEYVVPKDGNYEFCTNVCFRANIVVPSIFIGYTTFAISIYNSGNVISKVTDNFYVDGSRLLPNFFFGFSTKTCGLFTEGDRISVVFEIFDNVSVTSRYTFTKNIASFQGRLIC